MWRGEIPDLQSSSDLQQPSLLPNGLFHIIHYLSQAMWVQYYSCCCCGNCSGVGFLARLRPLPSSPSVPHVDRLRSTQPSWPIKFWHTRVIWRVRDESEMEFHMFCWWMCTRVNNQCQFAQWFHNRVGWHCLSWGNMSTHALWCMHVRVLTLMGIPPALTNAVSYVLVLLCVCQGQSVAGKSMCGPSSVGREITHKYKHTTHILELL